MSSESDQIARKELAPGERLLWNGIPRQGVRFQSSDFFMVPFSLMWGGFAIFWEYSVTNSNAPVFMSLWGIPFVLIGIYFIGGRFFLDSYQRSRMLYAITDQRAFIISDWLGREVTSLPLKNLTEVTLKENADHSGSIVFGSGNPAYAMLSGTPWPGARRRLAPAFDPVDDVRKVYEILQNAQKQTASS